MSTIVLETLQISTPSLPGRFGAGMKRLVVFIWKYFVGALLTQSILGSILVIGWTYRAAERTGFNYWRRYRERIHDEESLPASDDTQGRWPNWILGPRPDKYAPARKFDRLTLGLRTNFSRGIGGLFTTSVLILPGCLLWLFSWYDGWNNSFNKGYEQAPVGPVLGLTGITLFIAAMVYVPMAQARQAINADWRRFFDWQTVTAIISRKWLSLLGLAALYSSLALPLNALKTAPAFWSAKPDWVEISGPAALKLLNGFYFWAGFLMFGAFVLLRLLASTIYARGLLQCVQEGRIEAHQLGTAERLELERLGLLVKRRTPRRHLAFRTAGVAVGFMLRAGAVFAMCLVWFSFVAQIYIAEFFNYHPVVGWINQPLVQLPWFRFVPAHLQNPAGEVALVALVMLGVGGWLWFRSTLRRLRDA